MARKSNGQNTEKPKVSTDKIEVEGEVQGEVKATKTNTSDAVEVDAKVEKLMMLYPNLDGMWITPEGFVHPEGVPEHYRKNAKFYKNKYYKQ